MRTFFVALGLWSFTMTSTHAAQVPVYLASPSKEDGGIFSALLDTDTGKLTDLTERSDVKGSFLALHPTKKYLYAVGEDEVRAFARVNGDMELKLLNEQPSGGRGPAHVSVDPSGNNALVANYGGGSVSVVPIKDDGSLAEPTETVQHTGTGPNEKRQKQAHPHSINPDPTGKIVLVPDLGIDQVKLYRLDATGGTLQPADPPHLSTPPGGGPRHLDFHPSGKFLYVNNEMGNSVTVFAYSGDGNAKEIQTISTLTREPTDADTTSEVQVHPSGRFLYVANRGPDEIAAFAIDESSGKLSVIGHTPCGGAVPRHFAIDRSGNWLLVANQNGDNVAVLRIDEKTGAPSATGNSIPLKQPMCVLFP